MTVRSAKRPIRSGADKPSRLECVPALRVSTHHGERSGMGGLTLGQTGFAPAGRQTKFHGVIASSNSLRPATPGRTETTIRDDDADADADEADADGSLLRLDPASALPAPPAGQKSGKGLARGSARSAHEAIARPLQLLRCERQPSQSAAPRRFDEAGLIQVAE